MSNISGVMISILQSRLIWVLAGVIIVFLGKTMPYKLLIAAAASEPEAKERGSSLISSLMSLIFRDIKCKALLICNCK